MTVLGYCRLHISIFCPYQYFNIKHLFTGSSGQIFTSIFYDHYSSPRGFDFETEPVEYPIDLKEFALYAREHAETFRTNNILVPMGDDFRFFYAQNYFQKIDDLIR